jgi:hypothetical protein
MLGCDGRGRSDRSTLEAAGVSLVRPKNEGERWVALTLVNMAIWVGLFVSMAVIPSYWIYFADGTLKWTGNFEVPLGFRTLTLQMQAIRDVVVLVLYGAAMGAAVLAIVIYNKRNQKTLPSGEEKREATGGYK